jgi:hypothetical protein
MRLLATYFAVLLHGVEVQMYFWKMEVACTLMWVLIQSLLHQNVIPFGMWCGMTAPVMKLSMT